MNLLLQELSVLSINCLYFVGKSLLLRLVILLVTSPKNCLFVVVSSRRILTLLLLHHLSVQKLAHLLLLLTLTSQSTLILLPQPQFSLHFVTGKSIILVFLSLVLLLDNVASHVVHELLSTALTVQELTVPVLLLLVKHACVFLLGLHV